MRGRRRGFTQSREVHLNTLAILLFAFPRETRDRESYDNQFELILSPRTNQGRFLVQRSGTGLGHRQEVWLLPGTSGGCRGAGHLPASPHVDAQGVGRQDCKGWEACSCREARCSTNPVFLKSAMQAPMHASCSFASSRYLTRSFLPFAAALNSREVEEMTAECQAAGVQFMDGVMFMHHLRLPTMVKAVSERLGKITRLNSTFHFFGDAEFQKSNIRVLKGMDGLGCIGDLGWYQVRIMICLLGQGPLSVRGIAHKRSESGVITSCSASLHFKDGVVGLLDCGFDTHFRQVCQVMATSYQSCTVQCRAP